MTSDDAATPQVEPGHYAAGYDTRRRFLSYWHQIEHVLESKPGRVLEVGIGNGFVSRYLKGAGVDVHTVDLDPLLTPDTVASVTELPFEDRSFDVGCCFETLEHMPWDGFVPALREIARVSKRLVLISLPDRTPYVRLRFDLGFRRTWLDSCIDLPQPFPRAHRFDGQHHWEMGRRGFKVAAVRRAIESAGLEVIASHRDYEDPFHRFFTCRPAG